MSIKEIISDKEFEKVIKNGVTLIDFNAPWCAPCRSQEPIINNLADQLKGRATVAAINLDKHQALATKLDIQSIPTLIIFKNSEERRRFVGLQPELTLSDAMEKELN